MPIKRLPSGHRPRSSRRLPRSTQTPHDVPTTAKSPRPPRKNPRIHRQAPQETPKSVEQPPAHGGSPMSPE
eukprot:8323240-Pyramimonas_sp.AAC.1